MTWNASTKLQLRPSFACPERRLYTSELTEGDHFLNVSQTIKSYVLWTHPRGGFHYDVMVTVILAFIFFTPRQLFKDSPAYRSQHPNEIVVKSDGPNAFIYELAASSLSGEDSDIGIALKRALQPLAGNVEITRYETLRDNSGKVTGYRVWAHRA